MAFDYWEDIYF